MTEQQPYEVLGGFIDGADRSRRQIAMPDPVTQQNAGWSRWKAMRATFRSPGQASRQRHFASAEVTGRQLRERYPVHHLRVRWDAAGRGPAAGRRADGDPVTSRVPAGAGGHRGSRPGSGLGSRRGRGPTCAGRWGRTRVAPRRRRRRWAGCGADRLRCDRHGQVLNELSRPGPRTSPWMIYWRRGSSRDGVSSRPGRGRFRYRGTAWCPPSGGAARERVHCGH
jgi:hypothetical protein